MARLPHYNWWKSDFGIFNKQEKNDMEPEDDVYMTTIDGRKVLARESSGRKYPRSKRSPRSKRKKERIRIVAISDDMFSPISDLSPNKKSFMKMGWETYIYKNEKHVVGKEGYYLHPRNNKYGLNFDSEAFKLVPVKTPKPHHWYGESNRISQIRCRDSFGEIQSIRCGDEEIYTAVSGYTGQAVADNIDRAVLSGDGTSDHSVGLPFPEVAGENPPSILDVDTEQPLNVVRRAIEDIQEFRAVPPEPIIPLAEIQSLVSDIDDLPLMPSLTVNNVRSLGDGTYEVQLQRPPEGNIIGSWLTINDDPPNLGDVEPMELQVGTTNDDFANDRITVRAGYNPMSNGWLTNRVFSQDTNEDEQTLND